MKSCGNTVSLGTLRIPRLVITQCLAAALWRFRSRPRKPRTPDAPTAPAAHNKFRAAPLLDQAPPKGTKKPKREKRGTRRATAGARTPGGRRSGLRFFGRRGLPPTAKMNNPTGVDCCKSAGSPGRHAQHASSKAAPRRTQNRQERRSGRRKTKAHRKEEPTRARRRKANANGATTPGAQTAAAAFVFERASGTNGGAPEAKSDTCGEDEHTMNFGELPPIRSAGRPAPTPLHRPGETPEEYINRTIDEQEERSTTPYENLHRLREQPET